LAVGYPDEELFVVVEVGTLWETGGWDKDFVEEMGAYCVYVREGGVRKGVKYFVGLVGLRRRFVRGGLRV
jgi:hypothetical protein